MSFTTYVDQATDKVETLGATAPPSATDLFQLAVPGSSSDLYQASVIRGKLKPKSNCRICRVVVAALAHSGDQRPQSELRRMLKLLEGVPVLSCLFGHVISPLLTGTGSVCSRERLAVGNLRTFVATRFEQVMYISSVIMACNATDWRSQKRFPVEGGGFPALSVLKLDRPSERNAHRIGVEPPAHFYGAKSACDLCRVCNTENLVKLLFRHDRGLILKFSAIRKRSGL